MGKTTRFHPVSLHVIRGTAEYCGWRFGRIKQIEISPSQDFAIYQCEIDHIPTDIAKLSLRDIRAALHGCFAADISVLNVWCSKTGIWRCELEVMVTPFALEFQPMGEEARQAQD